MFHTALPREVSQRDGGFPVPGRDADGVMISEPLRVLLVEDEPGHAELARRAFEGQAGAFDVSIAETVGAAREARHGSIPPDLVIADWLLPDGEGLDLLRSEPVRAMPPIVIMTSHGSERVAVEAIRAGAVDNVVKSAPE